MILYPTEGEIRGFPALRSYLPSPVSVLRFPSRSPDSRLHFPDSDHTVLRPGLPQIGVSQSWNLPICGSEVALRSGRHSFLEASEAPQDVGNNVAVAPKRGDFFGQRSHPFGQPVGRAVC